MRACVCARVRACVCLRLSLSLSLILHLSLLLSPFLSRIPIHSAYITRTYARTRARNQEISVSIMNTDILISALRAREGRRHDGSLVPVCLTEMSILSYNHFSISILTYSHLLSPTLT